MRFARVLLVAAAVAVWGSSASAQTSAIPPLSSRGGAAYTLYLNFDGFAFTGNWGGTFASPPQPAPGTTPVYDTDGNFSTFSPTEIANMRQIWSRTAEAYAPFNVNITTVLPPATPASDFNRQAFYDGQARLMHTVIGGNGNWFDGGSSSTVGISFIDVASESFPTAGQNGGAGAGLHTNWTFSQRIVGISQPATVLRDVAGTTVHENGHALKLFHQNVTETTARGAIMDDFLVNSTRALWASTGSQNDVGVLMSNDGIGPYVNSGIGRTRETATVLPMTGTSIDFNLAKGIITPTSTTNPNPLGELNYTTDFFRFVVGADGANVNVTLNSGRSTLTLGTADPGATLDAIFRLLNSDGSTRQSANASVFAETITENNLPEGTYYFQISSAGADSTFFDMGSYFLTGTIAPVPEPGLVLLAAAVGLGLRAVARRRAVRV